MNTLPNEDLSLRLANAVKRAQAAGALPAFDLPPVPVERPKQAAHGDYATPIAMQLARLARQAPTKIAEAILRYFEAPAYIGNVETVPPGYINLTLSVPWLAAQADAIRRESERFGSVSLGAGERVQVEYVSANPTGPLHFGSARNAVLGDTLANVLVAAGYDVEREYYVNDAGSRMLAFYGSLYARYAQALGADEPVPEDGYLGNYLIDWGRRIAGEEGDRYLLLPRQEAIPLIGARGLDIALESIRGDLAEMGISYNRWFSERSLYEPPVGQASLPAEPPVGQASRPAEIPVGQASSPAQSLFDRVLAILRQTGYLEEREGALWFIATHLGGDKDEVIIRSNGEPGYLASDIAYHYDKFVVRGFQCVIDVWGADHQGHVPRMKAMMRAFGLDPQRLEFLIYQLVTLRRGGEIVRLSKRTGDVITLREVLDEIGSDALRFFLLSRSADSQMDLDLDLAVKQSDENPVYYVQYAHARIASILRRAGHLPLEEGDTSLLTSEPEQNLLRALLKLPEAVQQAAVDRAPHHLAYYAQELAGVFHGFYRDCRVISSEPGERAITLARLKLVDAARIVLARTLRLMGMSAPETM